ncbi:MAG TPA: hypothetical protein DER09_10725 [Prolixibacteraceae bacterium]|nr:hypothetical protein [Prolixibacteraceae bacterium]
MKTAHNHIIEKVFVEINTNNSEKAVAIKNDISEILSTKLFPQLETLFDTIITDDKVLRIGSLQVKTSADVKQINEAVIADVVSKIENGLKHATEEFGGQLVTDGFVTDDIKISEQQLVGKEFNDEQIFINFIQTGALPWFAGKVKLEDILADENWFRLVANQRFCKKLRRLLIGNKTNLLRFVKQIPLNNILAFVFRLFPEFKSTENSIQLIHNQLSAKEQPVFLHTTLQLFFEIENHNKHVQIADEFFIAVEKFIRDNEFEGISGVNRNFEAFLQSELIRLTTLEKYKKKRELSVEKGKDNSVELSIEEEEKNKTSERKIKNESLHINNAGLVLLHPFLKTFFITTGIADPSGKIGNDNLELATQALHFIATGRESVFEAELVFEKFLCGLPVHYPVIRESLLIGEIRTEAEEMLAQAIQQWPELKNTSPNGMRESFIQRNGILMKTEKGYKITVEAKTWDVLLDRLPWNYTIINWYLIDKLIFVEWQL